jgi:hypothetical protein
MPKLTKAQLGPAAIAINSTAPDRTTYLAQPTVDHGYGVFLTHNLPDDDAHDYLSSFTQPPHGSDAVYLG